jgi:hypothetical protein
MKIPLGIVQIISPEAVGVTRRSVDMIGLSGDIKGLFDNIDHDV